MWMMGYNDGGDFNIPDSFSNRKLRPAAVSRPITMPLGGGATGAPPCLGLIHGADIFALNRHLANNNVTEQSRRELSIQQVVVSSRWNPTPEQLRVLEDLYRRGTRTPSPEQIQHITAQLRRYGKIEGKNVFYWFQNHKARERQKRRRQMVESSPPNDQNNGGGARRTLIEEQTKDRVTTINCSAVFEGFESMQKSDNASTVTECTTREGGWLQLNETELGSHYRKNYLESSSSATCHMMQMSTSCPLPPPQHEPQNPTHHINTTFNKTMLDQSLIKNISPQPFPYRSHYETSNNSHLISISALNNGNHVFFNEGCCYYYDDGDDDNKIIDSNLRGNDFQTLQLFPLRSSDGVGNGSHGMHLHVDEDKEMEISLSAFNYDNLITSSDNVVVPDHHFYEFLPLKN